MRLHVFLIAALQFHRVHGSRFLQVFDAEESKKLLSFLLRIRQEFRPADFPSPVRIKDHGTHDNGTRKQSPVGRTGQLGQDAAAAGRLSRDGNPAGVAAEGGDIPLHPAQPGLLVQVPEVGRCVRLFPGDLRMCQKSQCANPVIHRYHHDTAPGNPLPVKFHLRRIAALQTAAEEPDQDRLLLIRFFRVGPDVQIQAVFSHGNIRIHVPFPAVYIVSQARNPLHGNRGKPVAVSDACPAFTGLRRPPAVFPYRGRGKRNSLKRCNPRIRCFNAPDPSILRFDLSQHCPVLPLSHL